MEDVISSQKEPYLLVTFSDGTQWSIPAAVLAHQRADYFAKGDEARYGDPYAETYAEEFEYTLSDDFELIDWAGNSNNWEDVCEHATLVWFRDNNPPNYTDKDFNEEWNNAHMEVVRD